jgi:hypothetical protein
MASLLVRLLPGPCLRAIGRRTLFVPPTAEILRPDDFRDLLEQKTAGGEAFEGVPLARLNCALRGQIFEKIARRHDEQFGPTRDAEPGGVRLVASTRRAYDWIRHDGSRIEAKGAQLMFSKDFRRWRFQFNGIKRGQFDKAILVLYTPDCLYLVEWDGTRYSSCGARTETAGGTITLCGPCNEVDATRALQVMLQKLPGKLLRTVSYDDPDYADLFAYTSRTSEEYEGVPLAGVGNSQRGRILEAVALRYEGSKRNVELPNRQRTYNGPKLARSGIS